MARTARPWYRTGRGWFTTIRGKQYPLGVTDPADRTAAVAAFLHLRSRLAHLIRGGPANLPSPGTGRCG